MKKFCGPITLLIDDDNQTVSFEVTRRGPTREQLLPGEMANVASWALSLANETGYTVDTTPLLVFLEQD